MERHTFVAELRGKLDPSGNGTDRTLVGHAAVFDKWSEDLETFAGTFREKIDPAAFDEVLATNPDVRLLLEHEGLPLARTKAGTLDLSKDEVGLRSWARISNTRADVIVALERGDLDQMSFAFTIAEDEWHEDVDAELVERTILRVGELFDVSLVAFPAYPDTDAALREMRSAAAAGKISLPNDAAPDDPAGEESDLAGAPADPADGENRDATAEAETDPPVSGMAALKAESREAVAQAKEGYLRSLKEITR